MAVWQQIHLIDLWKEKLFLFLSYGYELAQGSVGISYIVIIEVIKS